MGTAHVAGKSRPARHQKPLLSSLLLDLAHERSTYSHLVLAPDAFPEFVCPDGCSWFDSLVYDKVTPEVFRGRGLAICGPVNPADGPCGCDAAGEVLYRLRGTDLRFCCRFDRDADVPTIVVRLDTADALTR